ncbi:MAG: hypothetical protein LBK95_18925 [Bifidobacteriaceae bacterium]|nr:hypothetical protein [Bifidobacteriaceae bacterium]
MSATEVRPEVAGFGAKVARVVRDNLFQFTLLIELLVIFVLFAILTDGVFLYPRNVSNLLMQSVTFAMIAIPMVLVMVMGHIDLSVGSVLGFLGTAAATEVFSPRVV